MTYPAAPQPPVFPAGYGPLPSDFAGWVQTQFGGLTSKVVFRAVKTTTQSFTGGTAPLIQFNSIREDPYGGWSATAHQWTPPDGWTGIYQVALSIGATVSAGSIVAQVNAIPYTVSGGGALAAGASAISTVSMLALVPAIATVTGISGAVFLTGTSTSGSLTTATGSQSQMTITWIGG